MNTAILIPAYEPDERLIDLIHKLSVMSFRHILIIDDGSSDKCLDIFREVGRAPNCEVIRHPQNKGKGAALKTGFKALLSMGDSVTGCVTADADGQHLPEDILKVTEALENFDKSLILGSRDFSGSDVPRKSRMGNVITRNVFKLLTSQRVTDTQTGLRAIPRNLMERFAVLQGDRYEFEMNMLMKAAKSGVSIVELPIQTVYIENNRASHFRPFKDAVRIYAEIFKFVLSSLACSAVDIGVFALLVALMPESSSSTALLSATVIARLCSSGLNFTINRKMVFRNGGAVFLHAVKYFSFCVAQILCSWLLLQGLTVLGFGNVVLLKVMVDTALFFLSYLVQRAFVFRRDIYAKSA